MGEVYYAEDTKLHRPVALKRLFPELRPSSKTRHRILQEAQRASALSSEYIASVYDVLEDDGEILLVMEYVDGSTLRRRLETIGRLPLNSFLPVAVQCAEALAEAQQKGILHRDIKPENIMLTAADHVKILDFGLARQFPVASPTAMTVSTESRSLGCVGTLGYMAPEVLLEQELDARTDLFSLGIVFYEMLTGRHPFDTHKPVATADHILHAQPPPMKTLVAEVPAGLERIVFKMLAKSPEERYATAADLLVDLRALQHEVGHPSISPIELPTPRWLETAARLGIALVLAVLALLVLSGVSRHWKSWLDISELPAKKNLAVLPFAAADIDPDSRAFSQGLAETLTAKLSQLGDRYPLQVVSPSEIRTLATASIEQVRANLGVNLVLEGSFHQSGTKVRVNYNLVDAQTQRVLRADTITADAADPFALEDRVVNSALRALDLELSAQERNALASRGTSQPVAYDFYVRGRGYLQEYQKPENIESAIQLFTRALESDPNFALGYAGLGESYWQKYKHTHDGEWVAKALEACQRANMTGFGYNCLGTVYNGTGKYEEAASEFQHVLQTDRTNDDAYRGLAFAYEHLGKMTEAEDTYRRAISARPEYWAGYSWLGAFFYRGARYDEASLMFAQVIKLAPDNARGYSNLCGAYIMAELYLRASNPPGSLPSRMRIRIWVQRTSTSGVSTKLRGPTNMR
jgi:serine/threonine-protein kinase